MPAVVAVALPWLGTDAVGARAEAGCPGASAGPCPYTAVQIIGQRAEGVLRFPEAVAVDTQGNVYVADQLSYVVQKFTAGGAFETQWGSYGGGHGQFGPIGGLATDAAGNVYVVDSSHDRIEKFGPNGEFITDWGHRGGELGEFAFGSSQNPSQPPGGGIAVAGNHVYVADSANNRIERFNLEGGEPMAWGSLGSGPGQFSYPRGVAANESEVIVSDDDNHRIERFNTEGAFEAETGSQGDGPGQFGFPYGVALDAAGDVYVADDSNDRIVKLTPQLAFDGAWGGSGSKPGELEFPRALASDPAGDTYVADAANDRIEVFDPDGDYLRTIGTSAGGPGQLTAPRGLAIDPTGQLLVSDTLGDLVSGTLGNRIEEFAPGSESYTGQWTLAGGRAAGFDSPAGIGIDPRGSVYVADEGNERLVHLWGDGTFLGEIGGPAELGGAQLAGAGSVAVSAATGQTYVADTNHNRVLVYGPEGSLQAKWGAGEGDGSAGSSPGASTTRGRSLSPAPETCTWPTLPTTASSSSLPGGAFSPNGAPKAQPTDASTRRAGSPWTPPGTRTCSTAKTTASRCSTRAEATWRSGVYGESGRANSPSRQPSPWTATATFTSPTPTTTASSASSCPLPRPATASRRARGRHR